MGTKRGAFLCGEVVLDERPPKHSTSPLVIRVGGIRCSVFVHDLPAFEAFLATNDEFIPVEASGYTDKGDEARASFNFRAEGYGKSVPLKDIAALAGKWAAQAATLPKRAAVAPAAPDGV